MNEKLNKVFFNSKNPQWVNDFINFYSEGYIRLLRNIKEKGEPSKENLKDCSKEYLIGKLCEHLLASNYVDVANFAFLLIQKEGYKIE